MSLTEGGFDIEYATEHGLQNIHARPIYQNREDIYIGEVFTCRMTRNYNDEVQARRKHSPARFPLLLRDVDQQLDISEVLQYGDHIVNLVITEVDKTYVHGCVVFLATARPSVLCIDKINEAEKKLNAAMEYEKLHREARLAAAVAQSNARATVVAALMSPVKPCAEVQAEVASKEASKEKIQNKRRLSSVEDFNTPVRVPNQKRFKLEDDDDNFDDDEHPLEAIVSAQKNDRVLKRSPRFRDEFLDMLDTLRRDMYNELVTDKEKVFHIPGLSFEESARRQVTSKFSIFEKKEQEIRDEMDIIASMDVAIDYIKDEQAKAAAAADAAVAADGVESGVTLPVTPIRLDREGLEEAVTVAMAFSYVKKKAVRGGRNNDSSLRSTV